MRLCLFGAYKFEFSVLNLELVVSFSDLQSEAKTDGRQRTDDDEMILVISQSVSTWYFGKRNET